MRIEARHSRRLQAICLLGGLFAAVLIVRLISLQLWAGAAYSARAENQHVKRTVLQASRGRILDRHGRVLATNLEAQSFFVNNVSELDNLRAIAVRFSRRNGESGAGMLKRMREKRSFVWLARKVMDGPPEEQVPEGVGRMVEMRRTYPMGTLSGQVLGYTDIDNVGIEGIEMAYNKLLTGTPGEMASRVDARGKVLGAMGTVHRMPEDGGDLILTLDADYQSIAEEELAVAVSEFEAKNGIALVTDPRTGEILAMANVPLYDPNAFTKFAQEKRRNRAVTDLFEPGSTFKLVALAGALEENLYRPQDSIFCENGLLTLPGGTIRDTHPNGWLTVQGVIEESSNIGTIKIARKLDKARLFRYMRLFGFGSVTMGGLPGEVSGEIKHPKQWSGRSLETMSIGQEVSATALQMVAAYGAAANGGKLMVPRMIKKVVREDNTLKEFPPEEVRQVVSKKTAAKVAGILEGVVRNGTGSNAQVPGYRVAGKTGTAQRASKEGVGYDPDRYVSSFIGFLPVEQPELLCFVVVDSPKGIHWGSQVAAPVFSRIMQRILSLRDTKLRHQVAVVDTGQVQRKKRPAIPERKTFVQKEKPRVSAPVADSAGAGGPVQVPDVRGTTLRQAVFQLTAAGFKVKSSGSGRVVGQQPEPGKPMPRGTVCRVVCEKG